MENPKKSKQAIRKQEQDFIRRFFNEFPQSNLAGKKDNSILKVFEKTERKPQYRHIHNLILTILRCAVFCRVEIPKYSHVSDIKVAIMELKEVLDNFKSTIRYWTYAKTVANNTNHLLTLSLLTALDTIPEERLGEHQPDIFEFVNGSLMAVETNNNNLLKDIQDISLFAQISGRLMFFLSFVRRAETEKYLKNRAEREGRRTPSKSRSPQKSPSKSPRNFLQRSPSPQVISQPIPQARGLSPVEVDIDNGNMALPSLEYGFDFPNFESPRTSPNHYNNKKKGKRKRASTPVSSDENNQFDEKRYKRRKN